MLDIVKIRNLLMPATIEPAVQRSIIIASASHIVFWLVRETGTLIEYHVEASFGGH